MSAEPEPLDLSDEVKADVDRRCRACMAEVQEVLKKYGCQMQTKAQIHVLPTLESLTSTPGPEDEGIAKPSS